MAPAAVLPLPNRPGSLKFFVLGDFGTGTRHQRALADRMAQVQSQFAAELVITVGDNIYGRERPQDLKRKFEVPYATLLQRGVKFYASLGNHDSRQQAHYPPFNMQGRTYYSFKAPRQDVKFIALESDYPTPEQMAWLSKELEGRTDWVIPYFHHPLYSSGKRHGAHLDLRAAVEPLLLGSNVTVVFSGHEHFYERTRPQQGLTYFIVGSGGQLRRGNIDRTSGITASGFDTGRAFLAVEIAGDELFFCAIETSGRVVDEGRIDRRRR
ncbi:MAG TPA: metallophosphoesterase [Luteitalea sp.]|nr:metallophosphoesterase [Luteitalea sp.]